jgi:hypothetical protein
MRRSANVSAEKLVGDYLGRVLNAAQRVLPKGDRLLFVGRTRAAILKKAGPLANADPAKIMDLLAEMGDPRTIVREELERLETAHRGGPPKPVVLWRPVKDEWKPAKDDTEPIPRQSATPSVESRPGRPSAGPAQAGPAPAGSSSGGPVPAGPSSGGSPAAGPSSGGPAPAGPSSAGPSSAEPSPVPPLPAGPARRVSAGAGSDQPGDAPSVAPAPALPTLLALARSHPLETVVVVLFGVGGLIIPFIWLLGGLVAVASRVWDARDKWLALLGTPVFMFAALIVAGVLVGGRHGFFGEFIHAFDAYREYLLRAGSVLTAVYLAWRIRRGPRMRSLPPWQRPQRGPDRIV